ncbi:acetyltransferase (GNAT) family protein [Hirsutella rhossiliensis]|uniref:Acetyltransferase (GNAT) family domain-containing protein n=1 Tax=Hirsutella rhossiliensis TaxID=111463 RepID=A0A9P8MT06_9HYPO|nr:acetyltransferase (GNAT) family domain-containing protein [Hirsutella rhossiliensis]KAH0958647.1 acetyltransferase (GNAT) family domain-containing protein [Hirsutella rhossiliensis]
MGSRASFEQPPVADKRSWLRDGFLLTTDKSFLDSAVVNDAFDSDLMWWNDPLEPKQMQKMLDNCLTLSIYAVPDSADEMKRNGGLPRNTKGPNFRMVGFARIVTDYVTFAYLTDVFVLEEFQRKGLASWMMRALKELVGEWPNLRGLILMTHDKAAARMYQRELGAVDFDQGPSAGLVLLEMGGRGKKDVPADH